MAKKTELEQRLENALRRVAELEAVLYGEIPVIATWPAEVSIVFDQLPGVGSMSIARQHRLKHHINRLWLERKPVPTILIVATELAAVMATQDSTNYERTGR